MLGEKVDIILDGGSCRVGVESTVLDFSGEKIRILRSGGVAKETIEEIIGVVSIGTDNANGTEKKGLLSPGMMKSHYAPGTRLSVFNIEDIDKLCAQKGDTILFFDNNSKRIWFDVNPEAAGEFGKKSAIRVLSENGNLLEAAANLFETLHKLDRGGYSRILAQLVPETGLGAAINDRLRRAAAE
jgi:L-threonylcarbamoyladenylate synthase